MCIQAAGLWVWLLLRCLFGVMVWWLFEFLGILGSLSVWCLLLMLVCFIMHVCMFYWFVNLLWFCICCLLFVLPALLVSGLWTWCCCFYSFVGFSLVVLVVFGCGFVDLCLIWCLLIWFLLIFCVLFWIIVLCLWDLGCLFWLDCCFDCLGYRLLVVLIVVVL